MMIWRGPARDALHCGFRVPQTVGASISSVNRLGRVLKLFSTPIRISTRAQLRILLGNSKGQGLHCLGVEFAGSSKLVH